MRHESQGEFLASVENIVSRRRKEGAKSEPPELNAVRGLVIAATLSALFWAACVAAVWYLLPPMHF